jgi:serine/threonine protein kinase
MQYPLISEYVRAIQDASDNLGELAHLVPVLDDHGEPYRSSGAFAVVFKMKDEQTGKCYALKCFTEEQEGRTEAYRQIADELEIVDSSYITSVKYLDKEIFVDSSCEEDEFPVLLMDWIDGETMENYIAENYQDNYAMAMLCYRFCKMAAWLRSQPFAHGDIKPDNIMVRPDGNLTLVDYDGMFVPAMKGQKSPTIGTKDFSHPLRTVDDFDETIDDFALASIALSLKAISLKPSLLDEYGAADRLLFSAEDYRDLSKSKMLSALQELMDKEEINTLLSIFLLVNAKKNLSMCSYLAFLQAKPQFDTMMVFPTKISDDDFKSAVYDEYGALYSADGKRLFRGPCNIVSYKIKNGVIVICDNAFSMQIPDNESALEEIVIPKTVRYIGNGAFEFLNNLKEIVLPEKLLSIGDCAFRGCLQLKKMVLPSTLKIIVGNPFVSCLLDLKVLSDFYILTEDFLLSNDRKRLIAYLGNKSVLVIPNDVEYIGEHAFFENLSIKVVKLPKSVRIIEKMAFCYCANLKDIVLQDGVEVISEMAFMCCYNLRYIELPNTVLVLKRSAFSSSGLRDVSFSINMKQIDDFVFGGCRLQLHTKLPNSITFVGVKALGSCRLVNEDIKADCIKRFGEEVFQYDNYRI